MRRKKESDVWIDCNFNSLTQTQPRYTPKTGEGVRQTSWEVWRLLSIAALPFGTGLIIDAFGELRDQQEQVREDMEV